MRRFRSAGELAPGDSFIGVQFSDGTTILRYSTRQGPSEFGYPRVYEEGIPFVLQSQIEWLDA